MHITTDQLESLGRDLCRTLLIYTDLYIPPELEGLEILQPAKNVNAESLDKKILYIHTYVSSHFSKEDSFLDPKPASTLLSMLCDELKSNKDLLKKGDGDSSSGSDSAPSEDNMNPEDIVKIIPVVDKKTKSDLQKLQKKKAQQQQKDLKSKKTLKKLPSKASIEPLKDLKKLDAKKSAVKFPSLLQDEERKRKEMNEIKEEAMEEEKDGGKKKPKAEMVDAWTQTERSDYSIIKSRMLNHQQYANTLIKQPESTLKLKA